jgi:hypothetical protein
LFSTESAVLNDFLRLNKGLRRSWAAANTVKLAAFALVENIFWWTPVLFIE